MNLRIWDRPEVGFLAVVSILVKGPLAINKAIVFPEASVSSWSVWVVRSKAGS